MRTLRTYTFIGFCALSLLFLAACGTTQASTSGSSTTPTTAPTSAPTTTASTSTGDAVKTASLTVQGKKVTALTNAQGMTLYTFTPDTATTAACTGGCASTWPPLLFNGSGSPTGATGLSVVTDANGKQVQANGHFLYTYAGDSAPGQTNGEGLSGEWFVATTTSAATTPATTTPAATSSSSGY
ncbi:hypothetical protein ccbrp13_30690 [Ktedonobacteria bacterium brp13]|nr:hypothetical protein ccbrp13_30690 [Ktedonobacteria bacterium brp13]